jgi:hypothetical protein
MNALERGDLYASCGPEIHSLTVDGDTLHITCSAAVKVQLVTHTRNSSLVFDEENAALTSATFDISRWRRACKNENAFLRLIVTDKRGRYAVTRAYFVDELTD